MKFVEIKNKKMNLFFYKKWNWWKDLQKVCRDAYYEKKNYPWSSNIFHNQNKLYNSIIPWSASDTLTYIVYTNLFIYLFSQVTEEDREQYPSTYLFTPWMLQATFH